MNMELSQNKLKYLVSLQQKKFREEYHVFIAEGVKVVNDLIQFGMIPSIIAYNPAMHNLSDFGQTHAFCEYYTTNSIQDKKISLLATPPGVIAVFPIPDISPNLGPEKPPFVFLLDNLQDPGNVGTIIRTAHWFGIRDIYITAGSVEVFNPKVVQSSMGSLAAVRVHLIENEMFKEQLVELGYAIYVTDMEGDAVSKADLSGHICIVMGSESHGVSGFWRQYAVKKLTIPAVNPANKPESLNVATSAAILMNLLTSG